MERENIIKHALSTEKSLRLMESENKLIFSVDLKATKPQIREALEKLLNVKIEKITTTITPKGEKRAYIKFGADTIAIDVATNLGIMQ
jgi:large subunit ribosomal protein L23